MARLLTPLFPAILVLACGQSSVPAPSDSSPSSTIDAAPSDTAAAAVLAVAIEGDVEAVSETEYKVRGPEIRCSAFLVNGDAASPIAGLVDWKTNPADAGIFSTGATGVFFIPERTGSIEIVAEYDLDGQKIRSPRLLLHVPEAG